MTGGAEFFLDTNILLYAAGGRIQAPQKHKRAVELLTLEFGISAQVLAEFYHNAIRKGPEPMTPEQAKSWVVNLAKKPCQHVTPQIVFAGIDISVRYQTSYWDGAIIAAAEAMGATTLYSEDLNDGQLYGSVHVLNPFIEDSQSSEQPKGR